MSVTWGFSSRCCEPLQSWQQNLVGEPFSLNRDVCLAIAYERQQRRSACVLDSRNYQFCGWIQVDLAFPNGIKASARWCKESNSGKQEIIRPARKVRWLICTFDGRSRENTTTTLANQPVKPNLGNQRLTFIIFAIYQASISFDGSQEKDERIKGNSQSWISSSFSQRFLGLSRLNASWRRIYLLICSWRNREILERKRSKPVLVLKMETLLARKTNFNTLRQRKLLSWIDWKWWSDLD